MNGTEVAMSRYFHSYEAYRVPKGTKVKNASGEDMVLSEEEDVLVLTAKAGKQLIKDRREHNSMLMYDAQLASQKAQQAAVEKEGKEFGKIMAVYRAMARGDVVPAGDEKKLMEYDKDLYQAAKMAQSIAQQEKRRKQKSQWNEEEENADREKMNRLRRESDEAVHAIGEGGQMFSGAQKEHIVEINSDGVDFSAMEVMNLGAGVTGACIDLSI